MKTELIFDLPFRAYLELPGLNFSKLKQMRTSAKACKHAMDETLPDTDTLRLGRACHTATLEPDQFLLEYALYPKRRAGKAWEAFRDANADKTILTELQYRNALAVRDAVHRSKSAMQYLGRPGRREVTILWVCQGIQCKSRIDWLCDDVAADLKSTADPSPAAFARSVVNFDYHAQAAFYSDAIAAATGKRLPYKLIAAGKNNEMDVTVHNCPDAVLDAGRRLYSKWLGDFQVCEAAGQWPGMQEQEADLVLPEWAKPEPLTLTIGGEKVAV